MSSAPFENEHQRWFFHQGMPMEQSSRDVCTWFEMNKHMVSRVKMMACDFHGGDVNIGSQRDCILDGGVIYH